MVRDGCQDIGVCHVSCCLTARISGFATFFGAAGVTRKRVVTKFDYVCAGRLVIYVARRDHQRRDAPPMRILDVADPDILAQRRPETWQSRITWRIAVHRWRFPAKWARNPWWGAPTRVHRHENGAPPEGGTPRGHARTRGARGVSPRRSRRSSGRGHRRRGWPRRPCRE